jgi:hypothetical protein
MATPYSVPVGIPIRFIEGDAVMVFTQPSWTPTIAEGGVGGGAAGDHPTGPNEPQPDKGNRVNNPAPINGQNHQLSLTAQLTPSKITSGWC